MPDTPCVWAECDPLTDDLPRWDTTCGQSFTFIDGGPAENGIKFCCYCGHPVESKPFVYEEAP